MWKTLKSVVRPQGRYKLVTSVMSTLTLVRKDGTLVCMSPTGLDPKKLYEEEKELSKGFLFLVTINRAD